MDFSFSDDQTAISSLAKQILEDGAKHERLKQLEAKDAPRFDAELWRKLAEAGLLGVAIDEAHGGGGQGFLELALLIEQVGRTTAPVPVIETLVLGALAIQEFGSEAQKQTILPAVARGELLLTAALQEAGDDLAANLPPATTAKPDGNGLRLEGQKLCVPAANLAQRILIPASSGSAVDVFLVDARAPGVEIIPTLTTSRQPEAHLRLHGVRVSEADRLGAVGRGAEISEWIRQRATAADCALALGVCEQALALTSEYVKTRKQFDQPLAMFQAVGHRAANAYIDTEAVRLSALQACWRIAAGKPAEEAIAVAKYWAAEGGQRVVHAAQHLHGGIGVDRDFPLHRYFLYAKHLELSLGGATPQLVRLGRLLANRAA
jgi:alkylation response protein AidB-like acyl-CoA dehydrogenase